MTAAIAFENLAEAAAAVVTASGSIALAPPSKLLNPHVGEKWRVNATSASILIDLGSLVSLDTLMLAGLSGDDPDFRVRLSSVDATGVAGDVYDSSAVLLSGLPYFDPDYGMFVFLRPAPLSARYVLIDISEAGVDYIEAGRLFAGLREAFGEDGPQAPVSKTAVRGSVDTFGIGGQTFIDLRQGFWRASFPFGFLTETERNDFVEQIGVLIINEGHLDFLWIKDVDSDNLSRDCLWGYLENEQPVTQDLYIVPPVFSATYQVRQRL